MHTHAKSAFTLIELLVVIVIIGILTGIALPVYNSVQLSGRKTQALNNLRQLSAAAIAYAGDNSGMLPTQNTKSPSFSTTGTDWYSALPRTYMGSPSLNEYASHPADFYKKGSVFFVPAAKYPADSIKLVTPQFSIACNSKLFTNASTLIIGVRLQESIVPAETVLFQECGCSTESVIKGQSTYSSQAFSFASRTVARYAGNAILTFMDGHAAVIPGTSIVDPSSGKAYFANYPNSFPAGAVKIYWELDPTVNPNT